MLDVCVGPWGYNSMKCVVRCSYRRVHGGGIDKICHVVRMFIGAVRSAEAFFLLGGGGEMLFFLSICTVGDPIAFVGICRALDCFLLAASPGLSAERSAFFLLLRKGKGVHVL